MRRTNTMDDLRLHAPTREESDALFAALDLNKDGALDVFEIRRGMKRIQTAGVSSLVSARALFRFADADGSKTIDADEFHRAVSAAASSPELVLRALAELSEMPSTTREESDVIFELVGSLWRRQRLP